MGDNNIPYPIEVKGSTERSNVVVENLTQFDSADPDKNRLSGFLNSNLRETIDLGNMRVDYANGDVVAIKISGIRSGTVFHTVDTKKGGVKVTIAQTGADYAGASISL